MTITSAARNNHKNNILQFFTDEFLPSTTRKKDSHYIKSNNSGSLKWKFRHFIHNGVWGWTHWLTFLWQMWHLGWGRCFLPAVPKSCRGRRSWFAGRCSLLLQTYWCSRRGKAWKVRHNPQYKAKKRQSWRTSAYLDGCDVEWCGDTKNGHDDSLVLLVDEDLHVSDVLFSGHLRNVLIGHVWFSRPKRGGGKRKKKRVKDVQWHWLGPMKLIWHQLSAQV